MATEPTLRDSETIEVTKCSPAASQPWAVKSCIVKTKNALILKTSGLLAPVEPALIVAKIDR
ncbi:hypothetical protein A142_17800 [Vibrio splendidus 12E03]|uniref:Uncharacterized protein n=1 Tax=Vibrio splendidus 12E03 TaxID=1191305 RepID=A0A1E5FUX4_VIBSP|nr:hypothetical protein A142_17800 [Vibrio splendidus 12E03]